MTNPIPENKQKLIVKNVFSPCKDINKLNRTGYNFIYLACGFIAHYNLEGFKDYYSRESLALDILRNSSSNQWGNFRQGENDYEYYMTKKAIYNEIVKGLKS